MKQVMDEVTLGLEALLDLCLPFSPPPERFQRCAEMWMGIVMEELKAPRIPEDLERLRLGFRELIRTVDRWPAPAALLKALPERRPVKALGNDLPPATPEQVRENFRRIGAIISGIAEGAAVKPSIFDKGRE